jgi:hypothetical protein
VISCSWKLEYASTRFSAPSSSRHVRADVLGDEERDLLVELDARDCAFGEQDRRPHLELGGSSATVRPPAKARDHPFSTPGISFG